MQRKIIKTLEKSENGIPLVLKEKMVELVFRIREKNTKPFGLFIILGWQKKWQEYAITPDISQDVFRGHNIQKPSTEQRRISATLNFDGAILIDKKGNILHSGVMIEGLRPRAVAAKLNPGEFSDLSAQFGFKEKVHTRHLTAITASYQFKGITALTVSEESGNIHVFEDGKIVYSSLR